MEEPKQPQEHSSLEDPLATALSRRGALASIAAMPNLGSLYEREGDDVRVRRALALAIDKKPIVETVTRMGEPIADTYIPRGIFPSYPSPAGQPFDIAQARKLIADAGYPDGKGFPPLTILINNEGQHGQIAQIVQRQWKLSKSWRHVPDPRGAGATPCSPCHPHSAPPRRN